MLKTILLTAFVAICFTHAYAQTGVAINSTGAAANASAMLDVSSLSKGFLLPRMNTIYMSTITSPATGLCIYNTDSNTYCIYTGSAWHKLVLYSPTQQWLSNGNSGLTNGLNYIGTNDSVPFIIKVNGKVAGEVDLQNTFNTTLGYQANIGPAAGTKDVVIGTDALRSNNGGSKTVAIGANTLYTNTTGTQNTALGYAAMFYNTTGGNNNALGVQALYHNKTGGNNVGIGNAALNSDTSGNNNVAIGVLAGQTLTQGSNNIFIGYNALVPSVTGSNQLNIGNWIYGSGGLIGLGTNAPTQKLHIKNGHLRSEQTTAPSISVSTANGITAASVDANASDVKGNISTTGTNSGGTTVLTISFNSTASVAPIITVTAANAAASTAQWYVTSTTSGFTLNIVGGGANPSFNYMSIE